MGLWEFEPPEMDGGQFDATGAMPGTKDKLLVLADRVRNGQPLWHPSDREDVDDPAPPIRRPR
ncbi:MAG: hypothetical protein JW809_12790 [Pirellulales bacterium]|nr:hypothetical protein [Pirellulales bacterium]